MALHINGDNKMNSPKIFLSHVKENEPVIKSIDQNLTKYGINVITDYKNIEGGSNWEKTLETLIEDSDYFILCFSKEFEKRKKSVAHRELDYAIKCAKDIPFWKKWIIPIKINECTIPDREIRSGEKLTHLQWISLFPHTKFKNGIKSIVNIINGEQLKNTTNNKAKKHNRNNRYVKERKRLNRIISFKIDMSPIDFIKSLPKIKSDLLQEIEIIKDSKTPKGGTTIDICEINALYIDALQSILTKLASFYSPDYFIDRSPQNFFSEIIFARRPFYNIITEPDGTGTGGTISSIHYTHLVMEDIENLIKVMVDGLLYPKGDYPGLDYDNWLKRWRDSD